MSLSRVMSPRSWPSARPPAASSIPLDSTPSLPDSLGKEGFTVCTAVRLKDRREADDGPTGDMARMEPGGRANPAGDRGVAAACAGAVQPGGSVSEAVRRGAGGGGGAGGGDGAEHDAAVRAAAGERAAGRAGGARGGRSGGGGAGAG